jgi:hypothetical protein
MQQIVKGLVFTRGRVPSLHFKSSSMKWNAIITKSQYEKALLREKELNKVIPGSGEKDELLLLRILIRDFEQRQVSLFGGSPQRIKTNSDNCWLF